jgi:hypothetical protein
MGRSEPIHVDTAATDSEQDLPPGFDEPIPGTSITPRRLHRFARIFATKVYVVGGTEVEVAGGLPYSAEPVGDVQDDEANRVGMPPAELRKISRRVEKLGAEAQRKEAAYLRRERGNRSARSD